MRYAVILAGGGGTRLWPASRRARPKQFLDLGARPGESLLAATARRLTPIVGNERCIVVTAADQAAMVANELPELPSENIVGEPMAKNTAAALGLAAITIFRRDPEAIIGALPADHLVINEQTFAACIALAYAEAADRDAIVTVGIVPTRPETGFGYMKLAKPAGPGLRWVDGFVEKPDPATAVRYVASGDYLWNAGMFFVRAKTLITEIEAHLPETGAGLAEIAAAFGGSPDEVAEVTRRVYDALPSISFDYGVMEKTAHVLTIPGDFGWNDVGAWSSLADYRDADQGGNVVAGLCEALEARGNIVFSTGDRLVGLIGVSDLVVVATDDAVLVTHRDRAQEVRDLVARIAARKATQRFE